MPIWNGFRVAANAPITVQEAVAGKLAETIDKISEFDPGDLKNPNSANALINRVRAALAKLNEELYADVLHKLQNDILKKTDGCANDGEPDKKDWILTCEGQEKLYPLILRAIELLERLIE
jgi:hypothetical protein